MVRPSKSKKWPDRICDITLNTKDCNFAWCKINDKGLPEFIRRPLRGKSCMVVLRVLPFDKNPCITPEDHIWTCYFNKLGRLSGIGTKIEDESIIGREVTIIY